MRAPLSGFRAVHEILWGLFFINIFGLDPLTAILAIAIPFGAITSKVFSEILDETSHDPMYALINSGVPPLSAFAYGLIPLALRDLISYSFYRFDCAIRAAAVLGIIGAGGPGIPDIPILKTLRYEQIWTLLFALFLLNGIADFWSGLMRRRLGAGRTCCNTVLDSDVLNNSNPAYRAPQGDRLVKGSLIFGGVLLLLSFLYIKPDFTRLFAPNSIDQFSLVVKSSFPPDFSAFSFGKWLDFSKTTLVMSLLAVAIAGFFSLVLSFPAAGNLMLPGGVLVSERGGRLQRYTSVFLHYFSPIGAFGSALHPSPNLGAAAAFYPVSRDFTWGDRPRTVHFGRFGPPDCGSGGEPGRAPAFSLERQRKPRKSGFCVRYTPDDTAALYWIPLLPLGRSHPRHGCSGSCRSGRALMAAHRTVIEFRLCRCERHADCVRRHYISGRFGQRQGSQRFSRVE